MIYIFSKSKTYIMFYLIIKYFPDKHRLYLMDKPHIYLGYLESDTFFFLFLLSYIRKRYSEIMVTSCHYQDKEGIRDIIQHDNKKR